jgi:hypothetical protein
MHRKALNVLLTTVFSLLMFGMQLEGNRHALQHLGDQLHRSHEPSVQLPQSEAVCVECELLAGTASAVAGRVIIVPGAIAIAERFHHRAPSPSVAAPAYYSSRAPPVLL